MGKILIVEDSSVVAIGLVEIFKDIGLDESTIDTVASFDKMLPMIDGNGYGMVFFGLVIGQGNPLGPFLDVVEKFPRTIFVVFSEIMEMDVQKKFYRAGVKGVLDRRANRKEISFAIQRVLDNEIYMDTASSIKLLFSETEKNGSQPGLTGKEQQVMDLLLEGKKNNQICYVLGIMPSTVSTYKKKIFRKLNIGTILELKDWGKNTRPV